MVSWGDGEDSTDDGSSLGTEGPATMYDSDYCGRADDGVKVFRCKCNVVAMKHVAFDGCWTGRRFLTCAGEDGETCDYIHWVDEVWPPALCKSLSRLWEMYSECKEARVHDALNECERRFEATHEIKKLKGELSTAEASLKKVVEEKQLTLALKAKAEQALIDCRAELEQRKNLDASASNMHKFMRIKAENESKKMKEENKKLELYNAQLMEENAQLMEENQGARTKLRKIRVLCD